MTGRPWITLAAVALISACSGSPPATQAPTPAPTATPAPTVSPAPTATLAPTTAPTATPSSTPSPTATSFQLAGALRDWTVLGHASEGIWSPTSEQVLVIGENSVSVVDESGSVLDSWIADRGVWLDPERVVLFDAPSPQENDGELFMATVGGGERQLIGSGENWLVTNGRGRVAASTGDGSTRIWDGSAWTEPIDGYPVAWSYLGDRLAVIHIVTAERGIEGWLEILAAPDWRPIASGGAERLTFYPSVRFDTTGRYVAFQSFEVQVLDTETGQVRQVGPESTPRGGPSTWFGWRAESTLAIPDWRTQHVGIYEPDGTRVLQMRDAGDAVQTSVDGWTMLIYVDDFADARPPLRVVQQDTVEHLDVTGTSAYPPVLAPDGHAVLMTTSLGNEPLLIVSPRL